jgi:rod shape determining protein RodA
MAQFKAQQIISNIDRPILIVYLTMVIMGWLNIYAAVYSDTHQNIFDINMQYGKQLIWIVFAFCIGLSLLLIDSKFYPVFAYPIYIATVGMLILALVAGREVNGARAWFEIGGLRLQPGEFAKVATCLVVAKVLSRFNTKADSLKTLSLIGGLLALPGLIILLQNDTGSMLMYVAYVILLYRLGLSPIVPVIGVLFVILFILSMYYPPLNVSYGIIIGGFIAYYVIYRDIKNISTAILIFVISGIVSFFIVFLFFKMSFQNILLGAVVLSSIPFFLVAYRYKFQQVFLIVSVVVASITFVYSVEYIFTKVMEPHQRTRINVLLGLESDLKGAEYNVNQSKIAIGSGGFAGKGYLQGTQTKFNFVPEQSTDFIFCTVGEEWGFLGSLTVIGLFVFLLVRIIIVAEKQRSLFSKMYGYGVASLLFFHFVINVGMTIGMVPVIGIPLPFFSYGGSSLWSFTILLFIFLRLDLDRENIIM